MAGFEFNAAEHTLRQSREYPYDAPDAWWEGNGNNPPAAKDWAHAAARGVLSDLQDRGGIKHGFANIDQDIRLDIVNALADIIRLAREEGND